MCSGLQKHEPFYLRSTIETSFFKSPKNAIVKVFVVEYPDGKTRARIADAIMERLEDLLSFQRQLDEEEEFLTKLILQIDEQINRLRVEQMELQSNMFESDSTERRETKPKIQAPVDRTSEQLILSVPVNIKNVVEEIEEEEEDDDDDEEDTFA